MVEEKDDSLTNFESQPRDVHRAGDRANICADIILGEEKAKAEVKRGTGAWARRIIRGTAVGNSGRGSGEGKRKNSGSCRSATPKILPNIVPQF